MVRRFSIIASTLQIGEAAVIADRTGMTVVADFRVPTWRPAGVARPWRRFLTGGCFPIPSGIASRRTSAGSGT